MESRAVRGPGACLITDTELTADTRAPAPAPEAPERDVVASTGAAAMVSASRRLLITAMGAIGTAVLARAYGATDFGGYSSALAAYALVSAASDLGYTILLAREMPHDVAGRGRLLRATVQVQLAWCLVLAVIFTGLAFLRDDPIQRDTMLILLPAVVLGGLTSYRVIFNVVFRIRQIAFVDIGVNTAVVAASIALAVAGVDLRVVAAVVAASYVANAMIARWLGGRYVDAGRPTAADRRRVVRMATPLGIASLLASMYFVIDMALVGYLVDGEQLGYYAAAVKFLSLLVAVPGMVMAIALPGLSAARESRAELAHFARRASHWIAAIGLPACAACVVFAHPIIQTLYGSDYAPADRLLRILALAAALALASNVLGTLQITLGIVRAQIIANTIALTLNIAGNVVLVPTHGVEASAWLTVACEGIVVVSALVVLARRVDLRELALGAAQPALAVAAASGAALAFSAWPAIGIAVFVLVLVDLFYFFDIWPHELRPSSMRRQSI